MLSIINTQRRPIDWNWPYFSGLKKRKQMNRYLDCLFLIIKKRNLHNFCFVERKCNIYSYCCWTNGVNRSGYSKENLKCFGVYEIFKQYKHVDKILIACISSAYIKGIKRQCLLCQRLTMIWYEAKLNEKRTEIASAWMISNF